MTEPRDITDLIDHAIEAWETSPDAMRWAPDTKPDAADPGYSAPLGPIGIVMNDPSPIAAAIRLYAIRRAYDMPVIRWWDCGQP